MKKILYLFSIVLLGSVVASCHLNEMPKFNDQDAFASFSKNSLKIAEDGGTLNIPVHVTSLGGVATTISYEFVNGTATQGVDFEDASGSGTITFSAGETEKNISVKILPHLGTFTGDRSFSVKFKSTGEIKMGAGNTCNVTISDIDHPLSALFGTYKATASSPWRGAFSWEVTIGKDESDVSKVWLTDPDPYFASYGYASKIYGIVNADKTQIVFPSRQDHVAAYSTAIVGFTTPDPYAGAEGDLIAEIAADGTITLSNGWGVYYAGDGFDYTLDIDDMYYVYYEGGAAVFKKQ